MSDARPTRKRSLPGAGATRRRQVPLSSQDIVIEGHLAPGQLLPRVVQPTLDGVDLIAWVEKNRQVLDEKLSQDGGILFRNFDVSSVEQFEKIITAACGQPLTDGKPVSDKHHSEKGNEDGVMYHGGTVFIQFELLKEPVKANKKSQHSRSLAVR